MRYSENMTLLVQLYPQYLRKPNFYVIENIILGKRNWVSTQKVKHYFSNAKLV